MHWEDTFTGPRHDGQWTSVCKSACAHYNIIARYHYSHGYFFAVNGEVIATGTGAQKTAARDAAAREALPILTARDAAEAENAAE